LDSSPHRQTSWSAALPHLGDTDTPKGDWQPGDYSALAWAQVQSRLCCIIHALRRQALTWLRVAAHELLLLLLLLLLRHLLLLRVLLLAIVLQMGGCHRLLLLLLLLLGGCCGRCCGMDGQQLRFRGLVRTHCDLRGTHGYGRGWHHQGRHGQHYLRVNFGR